MRLLMCAAFVIVSPIWLSIGVIGQADDICREFAETPSREIGKNNRLAPYVYGRILLKGLSADATPPRVTVTFMNMGQAPVRQVISRSGNYCFKRYGTGGTLIIEVDGIETSRKSISEIDTVRQREDFEVQITRARQDASPGVVSAKFSRPPNDKTRDLYRKTAEAEQAKDLKKAVSYVKTIVATDSDDFIAWAELGSLYLQQNEIAEAEAAFKKSLWIRADYTPALLNIGIIHAFQRDFPAAIEAFKHGVETDPASARGYRLLGEAYLQNRQGTLGLAALDKALELDPVGMAECHLLKARLYDIAGAKNLATREYKAYLAKVPDATDKKKLEQYIRDNPE